MLALVVLGLALRLCGLSEKIVWHDEVATRVLAAGSTMAAQMQGLYSAQVMTVAKVLTYQQVQGQPVRSQPLQNPQELSQARQDPQARGAQHEYSSSVLELVLDLARHDPQHPPLYYVLAKVWVNVWGDSVLALRTLSVIFSVLALPALYWLMRELAASRRAAMLAVLFMGVSPLFILYGQEAREYALWSLTLLLSSAALLRARRLSQLGSLSSVRRAWFLYGCCMLIAVYTSLSTLSLILVQLLYVALVTRLRWSRALVGFMLSLSAVGLLFLPWALNLLRNFEAFSASMAWSSVIVIPRTAVLRILSLNVTRNVFDFWPEVVQDQWLPITASVACTTVVLCACVWAIKSSPRATRLYLLLLLVLPTAMLLMPDLLFGGIRSTNARYLMPVWLGVLAALALAFDQALTRANRAVLCGQPSRCQNVFFTRQRVVVQLWSAVGCFVILALATDILHARQLAPWTKSLSISLPDVAKVINQSPHPLIVGNQERHHPGNLFALANLLKPEAKMQLVPIALESSWTLPAHQGAVYLYSPTDQFRYALERNSHVTTKLVVEDLFLQLWKVEPLVKD